MFWSSDTHSATERRKVLKRACQQNNESRECSFLLELFLLLLLKLLIVWAEMTYDCTYLKSLECAVFYFSFWGLCQKKASYMQTFFLSEFSGDLDFRTVRQGFLAQDYLFYRALSWGWRPCGGILIVWVHSESHYASPFPLLVPAPDPPPLNQKLLANS